MSIQESIRVRQREQRLAQARARVDTELRALSDALAAAIVEYEGLLDGCVADLPDWVDADRHALREIYCASIDGEVVTIGPRAATVAVARVEGFARIWLGEDEAPGRPQAFDEEGARAWVRELEELAALLEAVAEGGREAARRADEQLPAQFEELLAQVEQSRGEGASGVPLQLQSLREKLRTGKTGAALLVKQNEAEVLEEQRRRTELLRDSRSSLEQLASAGAELGVDASTQLRALLQEIADAVLGAYPELVPHAQGWARSAARRERKFVTPPPLPPAAGEDATPMRADEPDAPRAPEPAVSTTTEEYDREIEFVEDIPPALVEESAPVDESPPAAAPDDTSPPAPSMLAEESAPAEERDRLTTEQSRPVVQTPAPVEPRRAAVPADVADTRRAESAAEAAPEVSGEIRPAWTREPAFRVTTSWEVVRGSEIAVVLGAPVAYMTFVAAMAAAHRLGLRADNPFEQWPWAFAVFGLFALWALGIPTYLNWRVEWDGVRPRVLRLTDRREEAFLERDRDAIVVAGVRVELSRAQVTLRRWRDGAGRGWVMQVRDQVGALSLAVDASSAAWDGSALPCDEGEPSGCWRISESGLLELVDDLDLVA